MPHGEPKRGPQRRSGRISQEPSEGTIGQQKQRQQGSQRSRRSSSLKASGHTRTKDDAPTKSRGEISASDRSSNRRTESQTRKSTKVLENQSSEAEDIQCSWIWIVVMFGCLVLLLAAVIACIFVLLASSNNNSTNTSSTNPAEVTDATGGGNTTTTRAQSAEHPHIEIKVEGAYFDSNQLGANIRPDTSIPMAVRIAYRPKGQKEEKFHNTGVAFISRSRKPRQGNIPGVEAHLDHVDENLKEGRINFTRQEWRKIFSNTESKPLRIFMVYASDELKCSPPPLKAQPGDRNSNFSWNWDGGRKLDINCHSGDEGEKYRDLGNMRFTAEKHPFETMW